MSDVETVVTEIEIQVVTVLGATGSIGMSTLDVMSRHPERFSVFALTGGAQVERLAVQCGLFKPRFAVVLDDVAASDLRLRLTHLKLTTEVLVGEQALCDVASAPEVTTVMAAIVGAAGLLPVMAAARAGKRILLANKEALVMAGGLMTAAVKAFGAQLVPIDSEHNAIYQCLPCNARGEMDNRAVESITLTASGGPFLNVDLQSLAHITPDQACAHPRWTMGRKISVDSATMMNKGLEVIEAHWLFNLAPERINVVIHPQSVIHSLVNYVDGSSLAQLGNADMRVPIAHALAWPERIASGVGVLDLATMGELNFYKPDLEKFKCLGLAFDALHSNGAAAIVLNAVNECAVAAFLDQRLAFLNIAQVNETALQTLSFNAPNDLDDVLTIDAQTREWAQAHLQSHNTART